VTDKDHILQLIKNSVSASAPDATLILYGSYARGDYHEESDIDLLILVDTDKITPADENKITFPLYDIEFKTGIIISPMVYTKTSWKNHQVTPFYENVNNESKVLLNYTS
jgi:predicted nucleotidyltransferase